jgi:hypothetical protein
LSDLPALAFMIFSFLFLVRFYQGRKYLDLAVGSVLAGVAGVVRAESLLILIPYLTGILSIAFETPKQPLVARLKTILKLGALAGVCSLALPLAVFGMPWDLKSAVMPLAIPSLSDLLLGFKWYALRDISWAWCLLAWTGLAVGLYRKQTRPIALGLVVLIAVASSYFASDNQTGADIPRFLVPTIPFTLFGMGFLWSVARRPAVKVAFVLLAVAYVVSVFVGLRSPQEPGVQEPSALAKVLALPYYLATDAAGGYVKGPPALMYYNSVRTVLPDGVAIILQGNDDLNGAYEVNLGVKPPMKFIKINQSLPEPERFSELSSLPEGKPVYVYPGPDDAAIGASLARNGFTSQGNVCGAALYTKP